jgi:hypothetical protein
VGLCCGAFGGRAAWTTFGLGSGLVRLQGACGGRSRSDSCVDEGKALTVAEGTNGAASSSGFVDAQGGGGGIRSTGWWRLRGSDGGGQNGVVGVWEVMAAAPTSVEGRF